MAGQRLTETARLGPVGQIPQQHRPIADARRRGQGPPVRGERHRTHRRRSGRLAAHRGGAAWPGRPDPTTPPLPSLPARGQGLPVRGERHREHQDWRGRSASSPRRRGLVRSARSHNSTVPSSDLLPMVARVCPSGANANRLTPSGVAGQRLAETARLGPVGQVPQQHRSHRRPALARVCSVRGERHSSITLVGGRSAAHQDGAAWPGRPDPTTAPSHRNRRWPGSARPGRTPRSSLHSSGRSAALPRPPRLGPVGQIPQHRRLHRRRWPGSARPVRIHRFTCRSGPFGGSPRRRGLGRSARSHNSTVPSARPVARVCPSGASTTEWLCHWSRPANNSSRRRGLARSIRSQKVT